MVNKMDADEIKKRSLELHEKLKGKLEIVSRKHIESKEDLSLLYTPGVAEPCKLIAEDKNLVYKYTNKGNTVAVITDGSAVLGLGDIGPEASLPVMEGKCILFKEFANIDAFPIAVNTKDVEEFIKTVKMISPMFGGINLEDISAPRCFEIEQRLIEELDIPVMHDDQHGTAVVVLGALINSLKVVEKNMSEVKIVFSGAGAAGVAVSALLMKKGAKDIIICDSKGIIHKGRDNLDESKKRLVEITNKDNIEGTLQDALKGADIFIGVSAPNILKGEWLKDMNPDPIIFAMANPVPEIMPDEAKKFGAKIVATGRSDFHNQVNNVLGFPGIFRGALDNDVKKLTTEHYIAAAEALASCVEQPDEEKILPDAFDKKVVENISKAISK